MKLVDYRLVLLAALSLAGHLRADEAHVYTQVPEIAPVAGQPKAESAGAAGVGSLLEKGDMPTWIWGADQEESYVARTTFQGRGTSAPLWTTYDNAMTLRINGKLVASSEAWEEPLYVDVQKFLTDGENVITAEIDNRGGPAGFVLKLAITSPDAAPRFIVSDTKWQIATSETEGDWVAAHAVAPYGGGPWAGVLSSSISGPTRGEFHLLPGFQVERLFTVPKTELGSWVNITVDPQGRLLASDEKDRGLYRITPSPVGSSEPTRVERLDLDISSAHGMLYAFDSLYLSINGGRGSGLYRARDTDNDDQFDELVKLKAFRGGGEHGPHALRLSPDGKSLLVICGNHTQPPFEVQLNSAVQRMGGIRTEPLHAELPQHAESRLLPNWDEDVLLPRQWDANGHAVGVLAPGGWIAQTDPDGKHWEVISSGYRNAFDMAFNADGELLAYDADMEWDMGMPWYRPTRLVHATSGSEFGWRSGTGKWPSYYVDSLPEVVDIGPGSPVGIEFGYGAKFPAEYQRALYLCDWTFGTIYAVHLEPEGASYRARKEEFLSRTPLPLTDAVVGHDGALYFTTGGRGAQSELFRVTYIGKEDTAPVDVHDVEHADLRTVRRQIEALHRRADDPQRAVEMLLSFLGHADRHIRYAARVGLEHQPPQYWHAKVLARDDADGLIQGAVAVARTADKTAQSAILEALDKLDFPALSERQQLDALRAWSLVLIRLGQPAEATAARLAEKLNACYPASESSPVRNALNQELCNLLVALKSPEVVTKTLALLEQPTTRSPAQMSELLARNPGYGGSIAAMLANHPETEKLGLAFALRNLREHWTPEQRVFYFRWLGAQHEKKGGASYQKFLVNCENDAYENASDLERLAIEAAGARQPYKAPELPKAMGPGHAYTLDDVLSLASSGMQARDFENGKKMFAAARCVVCHRFQGEGGATGPDLTQVAGRFNVKDLAESIVEPSKVVSDQYKTIVVATADGTIHTGRVISAGSDSLTMLVDPEDSSRTVEIKTDDIEQQQPSPVSLMPADLLQSLNENEVLDLLAYLLARGNPKDAMFQK